METIELYSMQEALEDFYNKKYSQNPQATTDQIMYDFVQTYDRMGFRLILIAAPETETPQQPPQEQSWPQTQGMAQAASSVAPPRPIEQPMPSQAPKSFVDKIKEAVAPSEGHEQAKKKKGLFGR